MKKMLIISAYPPYKMVPTGGGKTHYFYLSKLADIFDIFLITVSSKSNKKNVEECAEELKINLKIIQNEDNLFDKLLNIESHYNIFNSNARFVKNSVELKLNKLLKLLCGSYKPDFILLEWTETLLMCKKIKKYFPKAKIIASEHDVSFLSFKRKISTSHYLKKIIKIIDYYNMKHVEIKRLKNVDLIVTHNEKDKMLLESKEFCPNKIISIVPYFKKMKINYKGENSRNIVFFGAMSRPENYKSAIWFIKNVFFKIEKYGYRFIILGNNPASELLKYKSDNIEITGFVEDIAPYFERALCFVAPLIMGGGIKIKVLEALTSGVPVITNSIGIEGIPAVPDRDYIYCEKPKEYIEAIEKLTNNIEYAKKIGNNGRNIVEGNFNIDKSVEQYIQTILKI